MKDTYWVLIALCSVSAFANPAVGSFGFSFRNQVVVSANGRYELAATQHKNPAKVQPSADSNNEPKRAWPNYFKYTLTDLRTREIVWTRYQSQHESPPSEIYVTNDRRAVSWTKPWCGGILVFLAPNGKKMGQVDVFSELLTEGERKTQFAFTIYGPVWQSRHEYLITSASGTFFVIRTAWDRRIVVDLGTRQEVAPSPSLCTALDEQEKRYAMATLQTIPLRAALEEDEGYRSYYMAMHLAGRLQIPESIPFLRMVEADGYVSCSTSASEFYARQNGDCIDWCVCEARRAAQVALRRLGEHPRPLPTLVLQDVDTEQYLRYSPNDTLPKSSDQVVDSLKVRATIDEVLDVLGTPDYAEGDREEAWWRYEMDTDPSYTLIVTLHNGRVRRTLQVKPPLWQIERHCEGDGYTDDRWAYDFVSEEYATELERQRLNGIRLTQERVELLRSIVLPAAVAAQLAVGAPPQQYTVGRREKKTAGKAFRAQVRKSVAAAYPGTEVVTRPLIDAIEAASDTYGAERQERIRDATDACVATNEKDAAIFVLCETLNHEEVPLRRLALDSLIRLGVAGETAVPFLIADMNAADESVREDAIEALGSIGPEADRAVPSLILSIVNDQHDVSLVDRERQLACSSLGAIGTQPEIVVPVLTAAVRYGDSSMSRSAVHALRKYGVTTDSALATSTGERTARSNAAITLAAREATKGKTIPELIDALAACKNTVIRSFAAQEIAEIGSDAQAAVPILLKALEAQDVEVRVAAAKALWNVDRKHTAAVVPVLIQALAEGGIVSVLSTNVIASIGPEAKDAVPALRKVLLIAVPSLRASPMRALGNIGPDAAAAVPDLVVFFSGEEGQSRRAVAEALWKICRHPRVIPALVEEAESNDMAQSFWAVVAIREIGPAAQQAVPALIGLLVHPEKHLRRVAVSALEKVDPSSVPKSGQD